MCCLLESFEDWPVLLHLKLLVMKSVWCLFSRDICFTNLCVFLLDTFGKQFGKLTIRVLKVKQSLFISVYASPLVID